VEDLFRFVYTLVQAQGGEGVSLADVKVLGLLAFAAKLKRDQLPCARRVQNMLEECYPARRRSFGGVQLKWERIEKAVKRAADIL
jgi:hypothetical protein